MPTEEAFLSAADLFGKAISAVSEAQGQIPAGEIGEVVVGGWLGSNLPGKLQQAQASLGGCVESIATARDLCIERAQQIVLWREEQLLYEAQAEQYVTYLNQYRVDIAFHNLDPELYSHPGGEPVPPSRPATPPEWADLG